MYVLHTVFPYFEYHGFTKMNKLAFLFLTVEDQKDFHHLF